MDFGVAGVPERVEAARPGGNGARDGQEDKTQDRNAEDGAAEGNKKYLELFTRELIAQEVEESHELDETKNTKGSHMVTASNGKEANERNLHACQST